MKGRAMNFHEAVKAAMKARLEDGPVRVFDGIHDALAVLESVRKSGDWMSCGDCGEVVRAASLVGATPHPDSPAICRGCAFDSMLANRIDDATSREMLDALRRGRQKLATYVHVYDGDKELRSLLVAWDAAIARAEGR